MFSAMRKIFLAVLLSVALAPVTAKTQDVNDVLAELSAAEITAKDVKTLHYVENAHGQLDEFCARLLHRLDRGLGPRESDPVLDGRADLQVKKISVTYAGYTKTKPLANALAQLADAHQRRLDYVKTTLDGEVDWQRYAELNEPVQALMNELRKWSNKK